MSKNAWILFRGSVIFVSGFVFLIFPAWPSLAQEATAGPFTKLFSWQLTLIDIAVLVLASAATATLASYEFAKEKVSVFDVPTMPKYTVGRFTYRYFNSLYVAIVFLLFVIVMERYESLRQLLISQYDLFNKLPGGGGVMTISVGSVALIVALHYLRLPNSQIGPAWFLHRLRLALHKRARIPEDAQALAKQFLSDDQAVFEVPTDRIDSVVNHPQVHAVTEPEFHAARNTIDYQWAIISYLYVTGLDYETTPPYSSFVSNQASLWPQIKSDYADLEPLVDIVKGGRGDPALEQNTREKINNLRRSLGIFQACLHLFAAENDPERISRLQSIGLKQSAVFFVINRTLVAKFLIFIICGIAIPPLAFGTYAYLANSVVFNEFGDPLLIFTWLAVGVPMYVSPIIMVMALKRFMATSWPIRLATAPDKNDPTSRHQTEFKFDIYVLVSALSFAISCVPLLVYKVISGVPISLFWTLGPTAAAICLAVLIDFDVVYSETANSDRKFRAKVLAGRAIGLAILLGGITSWLTIALTSASPAHFTVYASTAAFIGAMIGIQSDFHRNIRKV